MKFVKMNNEVYVRHWFKWYYLGAFTVFRLDFKAANEALKDE